MLVELTFEDAKQLKLGEILYSTTHHNADGTPRRWKVNGQVKTWKTDPSRIRVPLKHGLRNYDFIDEQAFRNGICSYLAIEKGD